MNDFIVINNIYALLSVMMICAFGLLTTLIENFVQFKHNKEIKEFEKQMEYELRILEAGINNGYFTKRQYYEILCVFKNRKIKKNQNICLELKEKLKKIFKKGK